MADVQPDPKSEQQKSWTRPVVVSGQSKYEVDTPSLLLDLNAVETNIDAMAGWFKDKPCKLRPHAKTHKLPLIAKKQIAAGAIGITCAKLTEAEAFLRNGIRNILIANEIVGPQKIGRLIDIAQLGNLIICVDNLLNARSISEAATRKDIVIHVLVEVDAGLGRCGVKPGPTAVDFVRNIMALPGLRFRGVMGYEGGCFIKDAREKAAKAEDSYRHLVDTADRIRREKIPVEIVSAGGSNTYALAGQFPGITELQVGSYVTMDTFNAAYGLAFRQALTLLATVISRPESDKAIIDAGMKSLSTDHGLPMVLQSGVTVTQLNEEHGHLHLSGDGLNLKVGDTIEVIPSHGCTTIPLHEHYILTRGDRVDGLVHIPARGALF